MFNLIPYRLKYFFVNHMPRLEWSIKLPFGGVVRCNFMQQRIYPGRISKSRCFHEWIILRYFSVYVNPGAVFFDIGANIGMHTAGIGQYIRGGKIFCFEPERSVHDLLRQTISINKLDKFARIIPVAVSGYSGKSLFNRDLYSTATGCLSAVSDNSLAHSWCDQPPELFEVDVISIDDFCSNENVIPDIIKIDVEGAESLVLEGMANIIKEYMPDIIMDGCTDKALSILKDAGYKLFSLDADDGIPFEVQHVTYTMLASKDDQWHRQSATSNSNP
jgi:FkbM family methyltransferase